VPLGIRSIHPLREALIAMARSSLFGSRSRSRRPAVDVAERVVARVTDGNGVRWTIVETGGRLDSPFRAEVVSERAPYAPSLAADSIAHARRRIAEYARGSAPNMQRSRLFGSSARDRGEDVVAARGALLDQLERQPRGLEITPERQAHAQRLVEDKLAFVEDGRLYATNRGEKAAREARRRGGADWWMTYWLLEDVFR
jgi:hypothetical protein